MNPLIAYAHKRIRNNQNLLGLFCGQTGSGKSYSAIKFAEQVDDDFNVDRIVFNVHDFMELLNSDELKRGSCIIFDEAGVGVPAREWHTIANKLFGYVMQTFRHKNLIVLFTTPSLSYIDKQLRYLFHIYFESLSINHVENKCIMKPMLVTYNPRFGKTYFKYPVVFNNSRVQTINRVAFSLASKDLLEEYEDRKTAYTKELNEDVLQSLNKIQEKKEDAKPFNPKDYIDDILKDKDRFLKVYNGRTSVNIHKIRAVYGVSLNEAKQIRALVDESIDKKKS